MTRRRDSPFRFRSVQHYRRLKPGPFSDYRKYKPALRQEFVEQCVYCRLPDGLTTVDSFGVDHYRPKSKFPSLANDYSNLFYCCNPCNSRKGSAWPTADMEREGRFIPNPCEHVMIDHVRYEGCEVVARSRAGEYLVELLDLNDPIRVKQRELALSCLRALQEELARILALVARCQKATASTTTATEKRLRSAQVLPQLQAQEQRIRAAIRQLLPS